MEQTPLRQKMKQSLCRRLADQAASGGLKWGMLTTCGAWTTQWLALAGSPSPTLSLQLPRTCVISMRFVHLHLGCTSQHQHPTRARLQDLLLPHAALDHVVFHCAD
jgi:hypothetical protein